MDSSPVQEEHFDGLEETRSRGDRTPLCREEGGGPEQG